MYLSKDIFDFISRHLQSGSLDLPLGRMFSHLGFVF